MIKIRDALGKNPSIESEIIMCFVLNKNRTFLFSHPEFELDDQLFAEYQKWIAQREMGQPIAYITGKREFWSLSLKVNEHTLIPRHETELLVEQTLANLEKNTHLQILELGTGSGAISLALAKESPSWKILATDYSSEALKVAMENAKLHQVENIAFLHSNWFEKVPKQKFHAILSNPPYLAENDPHLLYGDLRFEPLSALVSKRSGIKDLELIIKQGYDYLLTNGLIIVEHGFNQATEVRKLLKNSHYRDIQSWKDLSGHYRISAGWR